MDHTWQTPGIGRKSKGLACAPTLALSAGGRASEVSPKPPNICFLVDNKNEMLTGFLGRMLPWKEALDGKYENSLALHPVGFSVM